MQSISTRHVVPPSPCARRHSLTLTHTHSHSFTLTLTLTHTHSLTLTLTHTHARTREHPAYHDSATQCITKHEFTLACFRKKEQNRCRCFNEGAGFQQCLGVCNESVRASLCPKATPAGGDCGEDEVVALIQHCIGSNSALNACIQSKEKTLCGCFSRNQEAHKCVSACGVEARGAICPGVVHKKTTGGAPRAAAGDAAAVDDKAEAGAAGEHLKSAFDLLDEMPLPGEDEQQQQQQTPPPPPPPPFRPQQHQTQNQPACDEAAGIARIRSCVGTVVALRSCLEDQSKDACFCIQQSEGAPLPFFKKNIDLL